MRLTAQITAICGLAILAACGGPAEPVWAPDADIQKYSYRDSGPATVTLLTVVSTESGAGRHSGLMISGRERIMFDPAGSFQYSRAPERNDVLFGMTDDVVDVYIDYHARETFDVHVQEVEVPRDVADALAAAVKSYGAVPKAQCSLAISRVLSDTPGFESIPVSYFPNRTLEAFAKLPGATLAVITDDDTHENQNVLILAEEEIQAIKASAE